MRGLAEKGLLLAVIIGGQYVRGIEDTFVMGMLVAKGLNNREIAAHLYLSEGTVRNYLSTVLDKLKLRDRTQLVVFYYQNLLS